MAVYGRIKLIGSKCFGDHISDTDVNHDFVESELASRMWADSIILQ